MDCKGVEIEGAVYRSLLRTEERGGNIKRWGFDQLGKWFWWFAVSGIVVCLSNAEGTIKPTLS